MLWRKGLHLRHYTPQAPKLLLRSERFNVKGQGRSPSVGSLTPMCFADDRSLPARRELNPWIDIQSLVSKWLQNQRSMARQLPSSPFLLLTVKSKSLCRYTLQSERVTKEGGWGHDLSCLQCGRAQSFSSVRKTICCGTQTYVAIYMFITFAYLEHWVK